MTSHLVSYGLKYLNQLTSLRPGETKFGEKVDFGEPSERLEQRLLASDCSHVLFGIPEDIGVMGNHGIPGTRHAWNAALSALLNMQHNAHLKGNKILVLGHLDFSDMLTEVDALESSEKLARSRELTEKIDVEVTDLMRTIVSCGKKPIVIGGGHNNAYGNLKGTSLALGSPINALNIDAHTDFRKRESRHSGNGFSWAFYEGFLKNYFIFGLQENYTSRKIFKKLSAEERIRYNTFEELFIRREKGLEFELNEAMNFVKGDKFGIEVDMDAIAYMPSSASSPSGFNLDTVRYMVFKAGAHKNAAYLHLCEAAPNPEDPEQMRMAGKAMAFLISDFIRK